MTAAPLIEISALTKSFGAAQVLKGIDLGIGRGEFFSLLGASGCGKTTLLRILAGIEMPTSGRLAIDGQDMARVSANRRPTNMVFQSYAIFPHLNVEENIGYGLANLSISKAEKAARIENAVNLVQLQGLQRRNAHALSGGQRQRVALARALVMQPKVLLLDEPLSALDKKLREEMQLELRAMQRKLGITFVFVTHDQEEAMVLSDRIAIMAAGDVLQLGTPQDLYERPASRAVAEFIGSMNLIPGRLADSAGRLDAGPLGTLFGSAPPGTSPGAAADLAIRPERIRLGPDGAAETGPNLLAGTITEAAYLGDRMHYLVSVPGAAAPLRVVVPNAAGVIPRALGEKVGLAFDAADALVLPG